MASVDTRERSRSPRRTKSKKSGGLRWKEKPSKAEEQDVGSKRLERGYRHDRDGHRGRHQEEDRLYRDREDEKPRKLDDKEQREEQLRREAEEDNEPQKAKEEHEEDDIIAQKFGKRASRSSRPPATHDESNETPSSEQTPKSTSTKSKPSKKKAAVPPPAAKFIVVKVNDRLGTTSKIPCLPSDSIGDFKKLVAAQIGRRPHEIMLKRQSERPFKDFLTLEDYGVSDGVQIDLELDTGD